jgi:hypothetical protein
VLLCGVEYAYERMEVLGDDVQGKNAFPTWAGHFSRRLMLSLLTRHMPAPYSIVYDLQTQGQTEIALHD